MRCELIGSLSVPSFEIDREKEKEREEHEGEDDRAFLSREKSIRDRDARALPFSPDRSIVDPLAIFRKVIVTRFEMRFSIANNESQFLGIRRKGEGEFFVETRE